MNLVYSKCNNAMLLYALPIDGSLTPYHNNNLQQAHVDYACMHICILFQSCLKLQQTTVD